MEKTEKHPDEKHKDHSFSLTIGDDKPEKEAALSKLTNDQIYQIELERAKNRTPSDIGETLVPILVPLMFFLMVIGIVGIVVWSRFRRNRMMHETVRLFAEKGQPLPPELFHDLKPRLRPRSDLRRGIFLVLIGLAVVGYFRVSHDSDWGLGLIPLCIGIGYLIAWKLESPPKPGAGV